MRCKPGDLAVIVRVWDPKFSDNIGKIVRCVRLWGTAEELGWMWEIESQGQPIHVFNTATKQHGYEMLSLHSDENLRPIRGQDDVLGELIHIPKENSCTGSD